MFSFLRYAGDKIMEKFQDFGCSDGNPKTNLKKIPVGSASKNLEESRVSELPTTTTTGMMENSLIYIQCRRCLSESSPLVIALTCGHKFCVNCILHLWSRQKLREPCVCPLDGEKMTSLGPSMLHEPEEISALVDVYNPLFNLKAYRPDMAEAQLERFLTGLYYVDMTLMFIGLWAYYYIKIKSCKS